MTTEREREKWRHRTRREQGTVAGSEIAHVRAETEFRGGEASSAMSI